jgi:hypothetical protein
MQQRQLRLGDILDDYCPRERRLTNHAVVAMVGEDVKQTRCTTCEADHEYKHAKVPRQRRKAEAPAALYAQVLATGPKRVAHEGAASNDADGHDTPETAPHEATAEADEPIETSTPGIAASAEPPDEEPNAADAAVSDPDQQPEDREEEEGPVHRPLIRASLPRSEGQQPPARPIPEFTIRQPGGRPNRFRPRHQRGGAGQQFPGNRSNGNMHGGPPRGGMRSTGGGGRPPLGGMPSRLAGRRQGPGGRKRSK